MNWLNIKTSQLREPEFIGSDPVARATWLCVIAYCAEVENGGRITAAKAWKDRQWQQTCGVTLREIQRAEKLLSWDGADLTVWSYPVEKEAEVQARREAGREGGRKSGEARGRAHEEANAPQDRSSASTTASRSASTEKEGKEKEKEKEREEEERTPPPARVLLPTLEQARAFAPSAGVAPQAAECWWLECEARPLAPGGHYTDRDGNPIRHWQMHLTSYGRKWQANEAARRKPNTRPRLTDMIHDPNDKRL